VPTLRVALLAGEVLSEKLTLPLGLSVVDCIAATRVNLYPTKARVALVMRVLTLGIGSE
jgi:hypothetical protein